MQTAWVNYKYDVINCNNIYTPHCIDCNITNIEDQIEWEDLYMSPIQCMCMCVCTQVGDGWAGRDFDHSPGATLILYTRRNWMNKIMKYLSKYRQWPAHDSNRV
jgi:hypothetical protein